MSYLYIEKKKKKDLSWYIHTQFLNYLWHFSYVPFNKWLKMYWWLWVSPHFVCSSSTISQACSLNPYLTRRQRCKCRYQVCCLFCLFFFSQGSYSVAKMCGRHPQTVFLGAIKLWTCSKFLCDKNNCLVPLKLLAIVFVTVCNLEGTLTKKLSLGAHTLANISPHTEIWH